MPRIDEMPEYRSNKPRFTHDLSHKFGFTATVAHLLPVFHDFLNAGETIKLGFNYNLRTQPLQSAAMIDINAHVEYFFVPMQLLYEPFGSMYYNINDNYSSNFMASVQEDFPVVQMDPLSTPDGHSFNEWMQSYDTDLVGYEEWLNHCYRLFDHIGFNNTKMNQTSGNENHNPNVFPYQLLAYHAIYQYYYRLDSRESFSQFDFNWDRYYNRPLVNAVACDYKRLFRLHYRPQDSDYFNDVKVSPIVDALNLNRPDLDVINNWLTRSTMTDNSNNHPNIIKAGTVGIDSGQSNGGLSPFRYTVSPSNDVITQFGLREIHTNISSNEALANGIDIGTANIRAMFAAEKLWSITGRARKHYDDQTLAHFGFKVPHDVKHEISCFGHDRGQIHIGEVISTSNVSVDSSGTIAGSGGLGEIAGKGYGNLNSKVHTFTAPCHGVVMVILSFTPVLTYSNYYLKCNSVTNRFDLYTPEYDHLGMQPLFGYEGSVDNFSTWNNITGWQYRYEQWKRRFNRVSKAFAGVGSLDSWMLDFYAPNSINIANSENYLQFCYAPQSLDQVMLVNYVDSVPTGDETKVYDGDPFVVDSYIYCKKVSTMSDYSLPRLDA